MANLALPFSLSDILERVIPGSLLIGAFGLAFNDKLVLPNKLSNSAVMTTFFLAGSYAIGVSLNSLAGFIKIKGYRQYWSNDPNDRQTAIRSVLENHFGLTPDNNSWSLCYGTVIKNGYGANTQLFLGLEVFCRAMTVSCILSGIIFAVAILCNLRDFSSAKTFLIFTPTAFILAWIFYRGARIYSVAFVASVYEGFYNWCCDQRNENESKS